MLIATWIIGILLGLLFGLSKISLFLLLGTATFLLIDRLVLLQVAVSGLCLMALGIVWGSVHSEHEMASCIFESPMNVFIENVRSVQPGRVDYVVRYDSCRILLTLPRFPVYASGEEVQLAGEVQLLSEMPEEYVGYADYLRRRGLVATMRYPDVVDVKNDVVDHSIRLNLLNRVKRLFLEPEAGVISAMLFAERGGVPDDVTGSLQKSGVSHILAISGLHVSLIAGALVVLISFLPISTFARAVIVVGCLWLYVGFVGFPVSAVRAAAFWSLVVFAYQLRLLVRLPTIFILTVLVLVTVNPLIVFEVGFQLSFAAVTGIGLALFLVRPFSTDSLLGHITQFVSVPIGAFLFTWAIVLWHFGTISLGSVIANILIVPVVPIFLLLAIAGLLTSFFWMPLGLIISIFVHVVWLWISFVSKLVSSIPGLFFEEVSFSMFGMLVYYCAIVGISAWLLLRQGRNWREVWV